MMKAPIPGRVKTRLASEIGTAEATRLYRCFVESLVTALFAETGGRWQSAIVFDPPDERARIESWLRPLASRRTIFLPQAPGDLGARLRGAFEAAFSSGAPAAVALGTDCLEVTSDEIEACFAALRSHPVVLGEAFDGGYWTIGMNARHFALLEDMPWSMPDLADATRRKARSLNLRIAERPHKLDVDRRADLERLPPALRSRWGIGAPTAGS